MFVIELIYKATLAEIDESLAADVRFLKKYYAAGNFLAPGERFREKPESSWRWPRHAGSPIFGSSTSPCTGWRTLNFPTGQP